jgi:hypothetical protein
MGARIRKSAFWEKSMSSTLKMFLIIEQKETASGMQIRMAHPALAEAVLSQILENNKETLSSLTLRFLDSANITSNFHSSLTVQIIICEAVKSIDQTDNISGRNRREPLPYNSKKYDFWRKIVIFHTKYPKHFF